MSDLQAMGDLALDITIEKNQAYEEWKKGEYNQEIGKIAKYIDYKGKKRGDGKPPSDIQAKELAKKYAMEKMDYLDHEILYRRLSGLLDRLLERKIEVQSINKQSKELK